MGVYLTIYKGTGKSRRTRELCAQYEHDLWVSPVGSGGKWFDGYDHHSAALFDDFSGNMPFRDMLCILEGNAVQVQVKGDFRTFQPELVLFTSDKHPAYWTFPDEQEGKRTTLNATQMAQLMRRFCYIEEVPASSEQDEWLSLMPQEWIDVNAPLNTRGGAFRNLHIIEDLPAEFLNTLDN